MALTPTLADFAGPKAAEFLLQRDRPLVGAEAGAVYALQNIVDIVEGGAQFSWADLVQMHITGAATGEDAGSYVQVVDDSTGPAKAFVQVLEGRERAGGTLVIQEQDAEGPTAIGTDIISFNGTLATGIKIEPGAGGHVSTGIDITADQAIVTHGFGPQMLIYNADQHVGIGVADMHLIGVSGLGTAAQHATVLA